MSLPASFSKNGYDYQLLEQKGKIGLYKAFSQADKSLRSFEVLKMRHSPERAINGTIVPAGLRPPSNEDFGTWAWSYTTETAARTRFNELIRGQP